MIKLLWFDGVQISYSCDRGVGRDGVVLIVRFEEGSQRIGELHVEVGVLVELDESDIRSLYGRAVESAGHSGAAV